MDKLHIADRFRGPTLHQIPRPLLTAAVKQLLVGELYLTDVGWFPRSRFPYIDRPHGVDQNILIYCVRGTGWFEIDGRRRALTPDQALLIPKNTPHTYWSDEANPWSIHWAHFAGEDSAYYPRLLPRGEYVIPVSRSIRKRAETLFRECYGVFDDGFTSARILLASQTLRHLLALLFYGNPDRTPGLQANSPAGLQRSFSTTIEHMRAHLNGSLTLEDMAKHAGFSVARFSALFRAQTGFSPVEYYIRLRIQVACRLLDTTSQNISEVSTRVGYNDSLYFSRIFRKTMGMPPTSYRNAQKG